MSGVRPNEARAALRTHNKRTFFNDEAGFTTIGVVIALLITLSLVFTAAQVYRLNAAASETQNVADAAALAALNEVAEFMIVVRVCDAVVLSLSLTSIATTGIGIAALCTPVTAPASETLLAAGRNVANARDAFAEKATAGFDRLQRLLPFLAVANAASVAAANNRGSSNYIALALLAPSKGEELTVPTGSRASEVADAVEQDAEAIKQAAQRAEEAAQRANEAKERAFERDCGANPEYCMYERAASLATMSGADNPLYQSVDAWSFSVALERAKTYYPERLAQEKSEGSSVEEQARSALRKRFYTYAVSEIDRGYVHETTDSFQAYFPHLPKNTTEMRTTPLYTEAVYPLADDGEGHLVMHAWEGCPRAMGASSLGSIAQMEEQSYPTCEQCKFTVSSMGKVAAASTSIDNGFEYHYEAVADAADEYTRARAELDPVSDEVKQRARGLFDLIKEALGEAASLRIEAHPPGSLGVMVLAVNTGQLAPSSGFESSFVQATGTLGARAAVSAATLVADPSGEGETVITSLLDGIAEEGGSAVGALGVVLDCWSTLLYAYATGQEAIGKAVSSALNSLPLASASGLGTWASNVLNEVVEAAGLEPAELDALKPVLVNSAHVANADGSTFSARLLSLKQQAVSNPLASGDVFTSLVGSVEHEAVEGVQSLDTIEIATIEIFDGGPSVTVEVALPPAVKLTVADVIQQVADGVRSLYAQITGVRVWE